MAVIGIADYSPENGFRVDLLNAVEAHDYVWTAFTLADRDDVRTVTLRATCAVEGPDYTVVTGLREDVLAALDEHGYEVALFQIGDKGKSEDRTLTVRASRQLIANNHPQQERLPL